MKAKDLTSNRASGYVVATLIMGVMLLFRWAFDPWLGIHLPRVLIFAGMALTVWYAGYGPAIFGAVIGFFATDYFFMEPRGEFGKYLAPYGATSLAYIIASGIIIGFGETMRRSKRRAECFLEEMLDRQRRLEQAKSERDQAARAAAHLAAIVESADDAIVSMDLNGVIQTWNQGAQQMQGYGAEEIVGRPITILVPPDRQGEEKWILDTVSAGESVNHFETQRLRKDGSTIFVSLTCSPIRNAQGDIVGVSKIARDITMRKHYEEELRHSEARYRELVENANSAIIRWSSDGAITFFNEHAQKLFGYSGEEIIGKHAAVLLPERESTGKDLTSLVEDIVANPQRYSGNVNENIRRDGSRIWMMWTNRPVLDEQGKVAGVLAIGSDITQLKAAEDALRASEARERANALELQTLLEAVPAGVFIAEDAECSRIRTNRAGCELLGIAPSDSALSVLPPDMLCEQLPLKRAAAGEEVRNCELELQLAAGRRRHVLGTAMPLLDEHGHSRGAVGAFTDITPRKRMEEGLREREHEFKSLVEHSPDMIGRFDRQYRHLYVNPAVETALGMSQQSFIGKSARELGFPDDTVKFWETHMDEVFTMGKEKAVEFSLKAPQGERHYSWQVVPEFNARGEVETVLTTVRDITTRKQMEETLRESDRRKDEFLAMLAHELRNPLAPLRTGLHLLRLSPDDPAISDRALEMMERQTLHLIRLVDDLLDVSRITRGKIELRKERLNANDIVRNAVETVRAFARETHREISLELAEEALMTEADPVRLTQVVTNLLNNALRFTAEGGKILVQAAREGNDARITVRDDGLGIEESMLQRVFEMFRQVDDKRTGGLGIGLFLVRTIVELHNGRVEARSDGIGKGSEFIVRIPLAAPSAATTGKEQSAAAPIALSRVLVVDDNSDVGQSLGMLLKLLGAEVRVVDNGPSALAMLDEFGPNAIILDIGMPQMSGYEVARRIRAHPTRGNTLLIALTGWSQEEIGKINASGFDHYLVKPADIAAVQRILAQDVRRISN